MLQEHTAKGLDALIVSARPEHLKTLMRVLDASSARVTESFSLRQAKEALSLQPFGIVFCDEFLSQGSYRDLLSTRIKPEALELVLILHSGDCPEYLEAMQLGAFDVLRAPLQPAEVEYILLCAITHPATPRKALPKAKIVAAGQES